MKNRWDLVVLSFFNMVTLFVLIFVPIWISIHTDNYYWLFVCCILLFIKWNKISNEEDN
jgi:hypothetical protein